MGESLFFLKYNILGYLCIYCDFHNNKYTESGLITCDISRGIYPDMLKPIYIINNILI